MIFAPLMYASQDKDLGLIDLRDVAVDSRITFTRSSNRTYFDSAGVLQTAGTNVWPREYDPATGLLLGRSVWASATNLCLWNRDFTNAAWSASNVTPAKDQTGIDGSANAASSITASADNGTILQSITSASATRKTSCFVKRISGSGTLEMTQDGGTTWAAVAVTAAWTRVEIASATVTNPQVGFRIGTNGDSIAVDFFQLENATQATPAIPTTSATVTRSADSAVVSTLSSIGFNASEGTLIVAGMSPAGLGGANNRLAGFSDGTLNERMALFWLGAGTLNLVVTDGGVAQASMSGGSIGTNTAFGAAFSYSVDNFAISVNGAASVTDMSGTLPTVDRLNIGISEISTLQWNGYIKRLLYVPRHVTEAERRAASKP